MQRRGQWLGGWLDKERGGRGERGWYKTAGGRERREQRMEGRTSKHVGQHPSRDITAQQQA